MANHKSAAKRARQTIRITERNKAKRSEMRTLLKGLRTAISAGDKDNAGKLLVKAQSLLSKLVSKGILKKGNASRKTSRLSTQVNGL